MRALALHSQGKRPPAGKEHPCKSFLVHSVTAMFFLGCAVRIETFARIFGIVFLIVGVGGFIPGLTPPHDHPGLTVQAASGMELGLFPVNVLHNLVHIAFGIWLHALLAAVAAYFGFAYREPTVAAVRT